MNVMAHASSSFEEARRRHLIEATVEAVADVGFKAASLSQIARRANVSTGLYAHYFRDKDGLLEATLRFLAARLALALRERLKRATTPRERLLAVVDAALGDQEFDRRTSAVWLAFWGQIAHSDRFQRIQYAYQRRLHTNLRYAFRACVPAERAEYCATVVAALIDGLWLQSHAYKGAANAGAARETVHQVVFTLIEATARAEALPRREDAPAAASRKPRREATRNRRLVERAQRGATLWAGLKATERSAVLQRCAALVVEQAPTLARLEADATGRSVLTTLEFAVPRCALAFRQAAARALGPACVHREIDHGVTATEMNAFNGVVASMAHDSAPLLDMCRAAALALGGGGALVVDISPTSRPVAAALETILAQAGVPAGAIGFQTGDAGARRGGPVDSAAIIFGDADIVRAIDAALAARHPSRRTPDLSETVLLVDKAALRRVETAAIAWCAATSALDPACGSGRCAATSEAVAASLSAGAERIHGGTGAPTILRLRADAAPATNLFAPILQVIGFASESDLLTTLARADFGSVAIFGGTGGQASRIARAVPAPVCAIDAYEFTCAGADAFCARSRPEDHVAARRLLTFGGADA